MSFNEASMFAIMGSSAFFAAIACVAVGLVMLHISRQHSERFFAPLLICLALCGVLDAALSGRSLQADLTTAAGDASLQEVANKLPVKLLLGFLAGLAFIALTGKVFGARGRSAFPKMLAFSFIWFYLSSNVVPAAFGYEPVFLYALLYTPMILLALLLTTPDDPQATLRIIKASLLLIVVPSLIAAVAVPTLVLQNSEKSLIPGYGLRLFGLTSHANVLGPAALTLCLIEWATPYKRVIIHRLAFLSGFAALVLTQSKTTILAGVFGILIIVGYRFAVAMRAMNTSNSPNQIRRNYLPIVVLALGLITTVAMLIAVVFIDNISFLRVIANRVATFDLNTVQGRTMIWSQAITAGLNDPFFGYGLNIWTAEYRAATGLTSAYHAHNQFLQVFSVAGTFGLVGMCFYLFVLGKVSMAVARASNGVSLALFGIFLIRSLTEVPIQFGAFVGADFVSHLTFLLFIGTLYSQKTAAQATQQSPARMAPSEARLEKGSYGVS